jgi:hypothetical protein
LPITTPTNVIMVYGQGGMGKSTLGAQLAAYTYRDSGKKTRVVNMDGGGTRNAYAGLLEAGIVSIWDVDLWDEKSLFLTLDLATKGHWPEDPSEPNSPLLPPFSKWKECPTCQKDVGAKGFALPPKCSACGVTLAAGTFCRTRTTYANGFDNVGAVVFEGFTSFGEALLRRLRTINPEGGRSIDDKPADGGAAFKISAPGQQHYGDSQAYLGQFVANTKSIPVGRVLWTALENRGEEDGKAVYGPKGPGQALTATCIPWFTDVVHLDGVAKTEKGLVVKDLNGLEVVERKLFLSPHYPADNKLFLFRAKTSAPMQGGMPTILDFPATGNTMQKLLELIAAAKLKAGEEMLK